MHPDLDPHRLQRFLDAQQVIYETALAEIVAGRKRSHWMWFIFPQARGLGFSPTSEHFGIRSLDEAKAYLQHPVLGDRLVVCTEALLAHVGRSPSSILGTPDDLKLRSSLTLFDVVAEAPRSVFRSGLDGFFGGLPDERTLAILDAWART